MENWHWCAYKKIYDGVSYVCLLNFNGWIVFQSLQAFFNGGNGVQFSVSQWHMAYNPKCGNCGYKDEGSYIMPNHVVAYATVVLDPW